MKNSLIAFTVLSISILASCDAQSDMAKKGVEKYVTTPTPAVTPTPEEPIDPADVVQANSTERGPVISVNRGQDKMNLVCDKYNRVMINGSSHTVTIKGVCSQIMLNGHKHDVTVDAVTEIVFNGNENKVRYSRYANGKRPIVTKNSKGENLAEKVAGGATK